MACSDTSVSLFRTFAVLKWYYNMVSLKELTKEQKYSVYMFMEEYDKSIHGNHTINPIGFYANYGVGWDEIRKFRDNIKEEERFSYAIKVLKEVHNERLFTVLLDDCYNMLEDMIRFLGMDFYMEEYTKLRELFKNEFGYDRTPISEILPDFF
jgi:hypothetical protein